MTDPFQDLVPKARAFLRELAANNERDWFTARKARYDAELKAPATALLDVMAGKLTAITDTPTETKLFRPNRDVRFSKDKTPYHTHLHLLWQSGGAQWFFGVSPDYITCGGGRMGFDKDALTTWRETVDGPEGAALAAEVDRLVAVGMRLSEPELKRVPAPYPADHPRSLLLRRKSLTLWRDGDAPPEPLTGWLAETFRQLWPVQRMLP
ncbi:TIGR02453 family protein [Mesobacterium pallidum]|uniref:TIGR02453 family protein n=1 Tax=Mesobacterium pallidum TaxID=2872037 RepID=UPI001EE22072|nr:TIGR02453 family protein [Mesobacterium pallidum]